MPKPEVILRADGNSRMGLGHLVRSLALAHMLESKFSVIFVVKEAPVSFLENLSIKGFSYQLVTDEREWLNGLAAQQVVVLDGYHFDTVLQRRVKQTGAMLVCIDDLHDQPFVADLIVNHTPGVTEADYEAASYTRFALGPKYALLRPSFLKAAQISRKTDRINTLLICFGGADINNVTEAVLAWAVKKEQLKKIIVVAGAAYQYEDCLMHLMEEERVEYYKNIEEQAMADLMLRADAAVVPSSSVLLEVIACGTLPIICYTVNNQKFLHDELVKTYKFNSIGNCTSRIDEFRLSQALVNTRANAATRLLRERISLSRSNHLNAFCQLLQDE